MKLGRHDFFEIGLFIFILLAPLPFGAVHRWGYMSLTAFLFFLFLFSPNPLTAIFSLPRFFLASITIIFFGFAAQFFFSSISRYVTGMEWMKWLACACGFVVIQGLKKNIVYRLMGAFILLGVLESLYGIFEVASGHEHILWRAKESYQGFVTGTYINRNHLAGLLEMALGVSVGFLVAPLQEQRPKHILWHSLLFIVMMTGLLKTGSRMGLTSTLAVFFIFFLLLLVKLHGGATFWVFGSWMALLGASTFAFGKDILFQRWTDVVAWVESLIARLLAWQDTFKIIGDHFWLGTGLGTYEWIFPVYQSEQLLMGFGHAHNDYLELVVELGFPLFLLLLLSFASLWMYCLKGFFRLPHTPAFSVAWGGLLGASTLAIHSLGDFNFAIPANHYLFILLLGMVLRLFQVEEEIIK